MSADRKVVPTSTQVRMRVWRQRVLPLLVWGVSLAVAILLYQRQAGQIDAIGLVQLDEVSLVSTIGGTVQLVKVSQFDEVTVDQVVVIMDYGVIDSAADQTGAQNQARMPAIRSPVAGTVTEILHPSGDQVLAGTPLLRISNQNATTIIVFLDEATVSAIKAGLPVQVFARTRPRAVHEASVARVGTSFVERPVQLRRNQGTIEWGVPVLLDQLSGEGLIPGQVVDLRFTLD
jgi:hypothetical protein